MKTLRIKSFLLLFLCGMAVSCSNGGGSWMEGYWVDDEASSYLFVKGDKIYMASPTSKRKKKLDYNHVKSLFDKQTIEPWNSYEIGNAIGIGGDNDKVYYRETIGVKDINKIKKIDEYVDESKWEDITTFLLEITCDLPSHDYKYLGSVQSGISESFLFSEDKEKILVYMDCDLEYDDMHEPKLYSKIEPTGKEKELSPEEVIKESWSELFDDRDIAVFDTGLMNKDSWGKTDYYYLFFHAYSFSDNKDEGTAAMCTYSKYDGSSMVALTNYMRYNYRVKGDIVYLTDGKNDVGFKLNAHEIPYKYDANQCTLFGDIWFSNTYSAKSTAQPIEFNYTRWLKYAMF